jgi:hypothetical protein
MNFGAFSDGRNTFATDFDPVFAICYLFLFIPYQKYWIVNEYTSQFGASH